MLISATLLFKVFWTGLAGACGAATRHTIAQRSRQRLGDRFPWGTLLINLTGAFVIGLLAALFTAHANVGQWRDPLIVGFLGGYTTFSTFALELARLRRGGHHRRMSAYLAASVAFGPLLAFAGLWAGRAVG